MTQRRTRRRPQRNKSALDGLDAWGDAKDRLNDLTPDVTNCAWPRCSERMELPLPGRDEPLSNRFGVLCAMHAADVAIAVIQYQGSLNRVEQFFAKQTTEKAVRIAEWKATEERYEAEKAALRQDREGFVYYLKVGERLKIGYSVDVKRRMRAYPPGSQLLAVEPGDRDLERQRHHQFAGSLMDGREWFRPTPDLIELVQELVQVYGEPKRFAHHYRKNENPVRIRRSA